MPLCVTYSDKQGVGNALDGIAQLAASRGHFETAGRLFGASAPATKGPGGSLWYAMLPEHERWTQVVRQALGEDQFAALEQAGRAMTLEQAVELALKASA